MCVYRASCAHATHDILIVESHTRYLEWGFCILRQRHSWLFSGYSFPTYNIQHTYCTVFLFICCVLPFLLIIPAVMPLSRANLLISLLAAVAGTASAFVARGPHPSRPLTQKSDGPHSSRPLTHLESDASGGIEEIEFRVYPDGRVTEVVRGVKGKSCESVTMAINKQLGNVVDSQPTEEMFEEEVLVETTLEQKEGGWDGASSW